MGYNFHAGDYVETKDGRVGYITQVAFSNEAKRWCSMRIMRQQNDFIISFEGNEDLIPDKFNRIGQYDFTKKKECKIEPLIVKQYNDYCNNKLMWDKINELIDTVNQLREKV